MHSIRGTDITLTRGDTLLIQLNLEKDEQPFTPQEGSVIRFAMKRKYTDEEVLINKNIDISSLLLEIEPRDTKELPFNKTYVYDIELTDPLGRVDTFIKGTLTLSEEVY